MGVSPDRERSFTGSRGKKEEVRWKDYGVEKGVVIVAVMVVVLLLLPPMVVVVVVVGVVFFLGAVVAAAAVAVVLPAAVVVGVAHFCLIDCEALSLWSHFVHESAAMWPRHRVTFQISAPRLARNSVKI